MTGRRAVSDLGVAITVAVLVHGPLLLRRGFALRGDMVFVPRQPWKDTWLGLDDSVARFVPGDAFVSLSTQVLPGDLLQKVLLVGGFVLGGVGAARLVGWASGLGRASAVVLFLWNPWVHDRLAIGQWGVVVGYLLLPWTAMAAVRLRDRLPGGASAVVAWLGAAAIFSPASGLVALVTALSVVLVRPRLLSVAATLGAGVLVNLPWILPSLLGSAPGTAPAGQFAAFRTSGESSLGTLASVLSLGGIWKTSVVAPERTSVVIVLLACALTGVALAGLRWVPREQRALVVGLGALAAAAVLLALMTALPGVSRALDDLAARVPAAGLLRDSQRYLGPAALVLLPGLAAVVGRLQAAAVHGREALRVLAVLVVVFPVLCLPSMFWGLGGGLRPVSYPAEWTVVSSTRCRRDAPSSCPGAAATAASRGTTSAPCSTPRRASSRATSSSTTGCTSTAGLWRREPVAGPRRHRAPVRRPGGRAPGPRGPPRPGGEGQRPPAADLRGADGAARRPRADAPRPRHRQATTDANAGPDGDPRHRRPRSSRAGWWRSSRRWPADAEDV